VLIYELNYFVFLDLIKTGILSINLNFFICSFLFSFFPKKEEMKRCILRMLKERRKKRVQSYHKNPRVTHSVCSDFGYMKYCRVAAATTQSIKLSEKWNKYPENAKRGRAFL